MSTTVSTVLKALEGDEIQVKNYRRKYEIENATVLNVSSTWDQTGRAHNSYRVLLNRRSSNTSRMHPTGGGPLFLTVGDEAIIFRYNKK
jgi:hypothetical protein